MVGLDTSCVSYQLLVPEMQTHRSVYLNASYKGKGRYGHRGLFHRSTARGLQSVWDRRP